MNVALLFFLLLVPLSGFIAWAGDRIGHKSGKKRHTLFGLRPRHTATLITIAAGMCISLVSFGLMWVSNASFRVILARGAELVQTNNDLKQQNEAIRTQVEAKRTEIERLDKDVQSYRQQADSAATDKRRAEQEYALALQNSAKVKTALSTATAALTATRGRLGVTEQALTAAQQQVTDARHDLTRAQQAIALAERKRSAAESAQQVAQADTARAQAQLTKAERDFQAVTGVQAERLTAQRNHLKAQAAQLSEQQQDLTELNTELASRRTELAESRKELEALRHSVTDFRTATSALRGQPITYRVGEEVDRVSIPAGISVWRIEFVLDSLLNSAGKKAESRGAQRIAQTARAVALAPRPGPDPASDHEGAAFVQEAFAPPGSPIVRGPNTGDDTLLGSRPANGRPRIAESDLIRAAAEAIRRDNKDVVVIAIASANAVAGEPVSVDIRTFHNPIVLTASTKIGEVTVDGTASRQEIVDALYGFLHHEIRARLLQAGVIPTLGSDDGDSTDSGIVTLSGDAWLKILDDIRRAGSRARVTVKVDRTTRAAEPVALRYEVKRSWDSQDLPAARHDADATSSGTNAGPAGALR